MKVRLQKAVADSGLCSRRKAETLLEEGRVTVNGRIAKLGDSADPDADVIEVDGTRISPEPKVYFILNKPPGYECSLDSTAGYPLATDLIRTERRIFPVGRLDVDSRGLLLLTNDGNFANRVIHPRRSPEKEYLVTVSGRVPEEKLEQLRNGIPLGGKPTRQCKVEVVKAGGTEYVLRFVLHEGRKRQIRRMLEHLGFSVSDLIRVRMGSLTIDGLKEGHFRELTPAEIDSLCSF